MNKEEEVSKFMEDCKAKGIKGWEDVQIKLGFLNGLSLEQIKVYAFQFNAKQMNQLRIGIEDGLDVLSYASTDLSAEKMKEKRLSLYENNENKMLQDVYNQNMKLLEEIVNVKAALYQMYESKENEPAAPDKIGEKTAAIDIPESGISIAGETIEEGKTNTAEPRGVSFLSSLFNRFKPEEKTTVIDLITSADFSIEQMNEISEGYYNGLPLKEIRKYAVETLSTEKMREIRKLLESVHGISNNSSSGALSLEEIKNSEASNDFIEGSPEEMNLHYVEKGESINE